MFPGGWGATGGVGAAAEFRKERGTCEHWRRRGRGALWKGLRFEKIVQKNDIREALCLEKFADEGRGVTLAVALGGA